MSTYYIKRNDRYSSLSATLRGADDVAVDLTGCTVKFLMRSVYNSVVVVNAAATIVTPASGTVRYDWALADTDAEGSYIGEFEVTYADGKKQTFPNSVPGINIIILADIA